MKTLASLVFALVLAGCATAAKPDIETAILPAKQAHARYLACLSARVELYLATQGNPYAIADAVLSECESELTEFTARYREGLLSLMSDPTTPGYKALLGEPEIQADALREKGRRAIVAAVLGSRM
jgi:hypothetical protein